MCVHTNENVKWFCCEFYDAIILDYFTVHKHPYVLGKFDKQEAEMESYASSYS